MQNKVSIWPFQSVYAITLEYVSQHVTVKRHPNAAKQNKTLNTALHQTLTFQWTPHTSPSQVSCGYLWGLFWAKWQCFSMLYFDLSSALTWSGLLQLATMLPMWAPEVAIPWCWPILTTIVFCKEGEGGLEHNTNTTHWKQYTVPCYYNMVNFIQNSTQKTPHSSPVRVRYGVSFVGSQSHLHFASVTTIVCAISFYIGPCYDSTRL